ncbi:hypothetical protein HETIRDRAFT_168022 [Heterobasidion irregulare TC 32-1]|uniref:Uncharacterized protein n=1 Tax=Heterobasidion irregulare (strain TC 32-1) TaxID=747525 RepID=W4KL30_HETIT|nr:uncharacterized protein HETIRDRAFT_168022 [Heterobasidion irregulare TC 32-1]ETW85766.1 hypothetical protein HETIRDRAFT_168022 [Heterobasidion irregulare TC 32-1]
MSRALGWGFGQRTSDLSEVACHQPAFRSLALIWHGNSINCQNSDLTRATYQFQSWSAVSGCLGFLLLVAFFYQRSGCTRPLYQVHQRQLMRTLQQFSVQALLSGCLKVASSSDPY